MNPEEVKKWYYQELEKMLGSDNPQDRRTALAELGKVFRLEEDEKTGIIEKLTEQLKEVTDCVMETSKAYYDYRKHKLIETLDKTNIPITRGLLNDIGLTEGLTEPTPYEEKVQAFKSHGKWPEHIIEDVNEGRALLQSMGFMKMEPILLMGYDVWCEVWKNETPCLSYKSWIDALQHNDLITATGTVNANLENTALLISIDVDFNDKISLPPIVGTVIIKNIET